MLLKYPVPNAVTVPLLGLFIASLVIARRRVWLGPP
jgi:hypothetical protein